MINVLIVEDDPMVADLNRRYVESIKGFEVIGIASNGEEAFKYFNKGIDLLILDIYMPQIDGLRLLKELRKRSIMIDVILVTASKETPNIDLALKLGVVDYLIKPFAYERIKSALESYLKRYELLNKKEYVQQEELDQIIKGSETKQDSPQKGIHRQTLESIRSYMKDHSITFMSTEEIAEAMNLSKVSIRRYLDYLQSNGEVELKVEYGSIGRPSNHYRYMAKIR